MDERNYLMSAVSNAIRQTMHTAVCRIVCLQNCANHCCRNENVLFVKSQEKEIRVCLLH